MKRVVRRASARLVSLVLPGVEAGACVPENGRCCPRRNRRYGCYGNCEFSISC